jgi:AsmA protein
MIRHPSLSWLKKIAGYAFFAAFALFALLSALVYWRFDEGLARQQIETALQAQGRQIRIQGSVHPILWPQPGVQFNQVSISTPQPPSPFADIGRIEARLAWIPLLRGRQVIHALSLENVTASIARNKAGEWNIADLLSLRAAPDLRIKLDALSIKGLALDYHDAQLDTSARLSEVAIEIDGLLASATLTASGMAEKGGAPVRFALISPLTIADDQITIDPFDLSLAGTLVNLPESRATLSGIVRINQVSQRVTTSKLALSLESRQPVVSLSARSPSADFDLSKSGFNIPQLDVTAKVGSTAGEYRFEGHINGLAGQGAQLDAKEVKGALGWKVDGGHALTVQLAAPVEVTGWSQVKLAPVKLSTTLATPLLPRGELKTTATGEMSADFARQRVDATLNGMIDGQHFTLEGRQTGFITPHHTVKLALDKLNLNRYLAEPEGNRVGLFYGNRPFELGWMKATNVDGELKIGELVAGRFAMQAVGTRFTVNHKKLAFNHIVASIYQGKLAGSVLLEKEDTPKLTVKETLTGMSIRPLLEDLLDFGRVEGKGRLEATLTAEGNTFAAWRKTLSGDVRVGLTQGALQGIDLVEAIKRLPTELSTLSSTPVQGDQKKKTPFQSLAAHFVFEKGVGRNQDLRLNSSLLTLNGGGKIDLVDNIVDYAFAVKPNAKAFPTLQEVSVPLKITGALAAPIYALDFNTLIKDKKTEGEKQQVLKEQLTNQIKLFKTP